MALPKLAFGFDIAVTASEFEFRGGNHGHCEENEEEREASPQSEEAGRAEAAYHVRGTC
jgi:hypothetical protein